MKYLNNTGVTLLEILLASIIFVLSVAGIFATLTAVRAPVAVKENALAAAVFGKQALETLRSQVTALPTSNFYSTCGGTCTDFALEMGLHQVPHTNLPSGLTWPSALAAKNTVCDASGCLVYTITCGDGSACTGGHANVARRVDLNIQW